MTSPDQYFMGQAVVMARRGLGRAWPNPAVGAVLVSPGDIAEILARGWTMPGGRPHAEQVVLEKAGARARGATLYVTLEPCSHHGKTPPCVDAIIRAGIARVVCGITDPDPRVDGRGIEMLCAAGIEVTTGVLAETVKRITGGHLRRLEWGRPWVTLKIAVGSDGLVAPGDGKPVWVTGEQARDNAHLLRARADAILIGRGTLEADDPALTCRLPGLEDRSPVRVVLDSQLRTITRSAKLLEGGCAAAPVWIFCDDNAPNEREAELRNAGASVIRVPERGDGGLDLPAVMRALVQRGITRLLVEGGPRIAQSCIEAGIIDEVIIFTGSVPAGPSGLKPFGRYPIEQVTEHEAFRLFDVRSAGEDRIEVYSI